jgi:hypothetical protein
MGCFSARLCFCRRWLTLQIAPATILTHQKATTPELLYSFTPPHATRIHHLADRQAIVTRSAERIQDRCALDSGSTAGMV